MGGMFVTWLAQSYGILKPEIMGYLSGGSACRVVKAKSLKQMDVVMELGDGSYHWHAIGGAAGVGGDDDDEDEPQQQQYGGFEAGSADYYRHMSQGDWQAHQGAWMGQVDAWRTTTNHRFY